MGIIRSIVWIQVTVSKVLTYKKPPTLSQAVIAKQPESKTHMGTNARGITARLISHCEFYVLHK